MQLSKLAVRYDPLYGSLGVEGLRLQFRHTPLTTLTSKRYACNAPYP